MFFNSYKCQNIGPGELHDMVQRGKDFLLLDVRTPREYTGDAIENSTLIPLQELEHRVRELPRDKEIVVYCRVGNRSAYACSFLARLGYRVKNLEGGIMLWNRAGLASMSRV
ncbi:MAG TPA: rhodanese-like domain-containing protein [Nitrospirota bacterium]|nr:rhodanese-like domain-containing protein [Nitrospirota bacterium]